MADNDDIQYGTRVDAPIVAGGNVNDDWPSAYNYQLQGAVQNFNTIAERDKWSTKYRSRVFKTIAFVKANADGDPEWFQWTGTKKDGSDGTWQHVDIYPAPGRGITIVKPDGSTVTDIDVFGLKGLELQGNVKDGFNLVVTGGGAVSVKQEGNNGADYTGINQIIIDPSLTLKSKSQNTVTIGLPHGVYERHHNEGYLAYLDMDEVIIGKSEPGNRKRGAMWADKIAWGGGNIDIYPERDTKSVIIQDPFDDDPNVTGGAPILCGLHIGFYGKAPDDGTVEAYLVNGMDGSVLKDASGQPIGLIHHYKSGEKLQPLTALQVYMAKGAVKAQWIVKHTFINEPLVIGDWAARGSCMLYQVLGPKESLSPAISEFEQLIGRDIRILSKYYGPYIKSDKWALDFDEPEQTFSPNAGLDSSLGIDAENPTKIKASVSKGAMTIKDAGEDALFNIAVELNHEDTFALRGKKVKVTTHINENSNTINLAMFKYTGNLMDVPRPVLKDLVNYNYQLATGWEFVSKTAAIGDIKDGFYELSDTFTIPDDANLVMFAVTPVEKTHPVITTVKTITVDVVDPFTAFDVNFDSLGNELTLNKVKSEFVTRNLAWAIGTTKTNLPFGEHVSSVNNAQVELVVDEDDSTRYDGGMKLTGLGKYTIEIWLSVINYFKTKLDSDETVRFWVEDADGNKIADSDKEFVLKPGDNGFHVINWQFDYDNQSAGTVLKLFGQSDKAKAAYLAQGTYNSAGVSITQELVP